METIGAICHAASGTCNYVLRSPGGSCTSENCGSVRAYLAPSSLVEPSGPASLVGALQDRVHKEVGITRAAHARRNGMRTAEHGDLFPYSPWPRYGSRP